MKFRAIRYAQLPEPVKDAFLAAFARRGLRSERVRGWWTWCDPTLGTYVMNRRDEWFAAR